jgi:hypothetical protein
VIRALIVLLLVFATQAARADDNRPLVVSLEEVSPGTWEASRKLPANLVADWLPRVAAPRGCAVSAPRVWQDALGFWGAERWTCEGPIAGDALTIAYPGGAPPLATIVRVVHADGREETLLGQPGEKRIALPAVASAKNPFSRFLVLGVEHIWLGIDHLLFVAGLIFVAGTVRRTAVTITGFTLSHSLTLALAALGVVTFPPGAVEAVIALSIVFLAVEIAKGPRDTLTWRRPVFVAASFGLLHGFGFAAVLGEIGLPREGLVAALLAFNLGIEIGQVLFAAVILALLQAMARLPALADPQRVRRIGAYAVGILASYWMFDRLS